MADEKNVIDLDLPAGKLFAQYPDLQGLLAEMGVGYVDAEKTLPEVVSRKTGMPYFTISANMSSEGLGIVNLRSMRRT